MESSPAAVSRPLTKRRWSRYRRGSTNLTMPPPEEAATTMDDLTLFSGGTSPTLARRLRKNTNNNKHGLLSIQDDSSLGLQSPNKTATRIPLFGRRKSSTHEVDDCIAISSASSSDDNNDNNKRRTKWRGGRRRHHLNLKNPFFLHKSRSDDDDSVVGVRRDMRRIESFESDDSGDSSAAVAATAPLRLFSKRSGDSLQSSSHSMPPILRRRSDSADAADTATAADSPSTAPRNVSFDERPPLQNVILEEGSMVDLISKQQSNNGNNNHHWRSFDDITLSSPGERARYSIYHDKKSSLKRKFRVRPYHRFSRPVQMTEEEIYADSLKPSKEFEFLKTYLAPSCPTKEEEDSTNNNIPQRIQDMWGSPAQDGRIGSIRVEVLGCISLARQSKPDVSVYMVCGDAAFCTDVLSGYRSPMWPCQSKRAAVFPLHHAYAQLYIGVFDARVRKNKENDVFCGRVVLDISTLRPDTQYDVTFPLRASSFIYDRRPRGVIRLRFSLHWFSERAAVMSYLKSPQSLTKNCPLVEGQPAIPCADPKSFRNVAVTVYGLDLPGKYSRNAFRATMREFNLYQQNLRQLVATTVVDAVLYENPLLSLYLFVTGMYCVVSASMRMVPPYLVGYVLILLAENHKHYIQQSAFNLGYKPLTVVEIAKGLFFGVNRKKGPCFESAVIQKQTKRRKTKTGPAQRLRQLDGLEIGSEHEDNERENEIERLDHREFPFSERDAYPKLSVEEALAPSSKSSRSIGSRKGSMSRLHGRLSVYYTASSSGPSPFSMVDGEEQDDSSDGSRDDREDDETVSNFAGDSVFDLDYDNEDEDMNMENGPDFDTVSSRLLQSSETSSARPRIRPGPPQSNDVEAAKKIPPQVHLKRVEALLHRVSMGLSVELVHPPLSLLNRKSPQSGEPASVAPATSPNSVQAHPDALKKKKAPLDEYDKLLGLQSRTPNPVMRIASSFLGPLMRIIRIFVYLVRIAFNVSTWRDPYLSFWVSLALFVVFLILIIFPWRLFFFLLTFASFGPQNVLVRKYLEKKELEKMQENAREKDELEPSNTNTGSRHGEATPSSADNEIKSSKHGKMEGSNHSARQAMLQKKVSQKKKFRQAIRRNSSEDSLGLGEWEIERPPFRSDLRRQAISGKRLQPRSVVIPYSRFRKDRFYDWPPDPTVSKAMPVNYCDEQPPLDSSNSDHAFAEVPSTPDAKTSRPGLRHRRGSNGW